MLTRLKKGLFSSETDRTLEKLKVDKSQELITNRALNILLTQFKTPKHKNQLLNTLYNKIHSDNTTLRIKSLVVMHACVRDSFDDDLVEVIQN